MTEEHPERGRAQLRLTEAEIQRLVDLAKPLPTDYWSSLLPRTKTGHRERELEVVAEGGVEFQIRIRQSVKNALDFSVILSYRPPNSSQLFHLRRYNGLSHPHTNRIERRSFYAHHVHLATERYQELEGMEEESYAEPTDRYATLEEAIHCMLRDCNFHGPGGMLQGRLFPRDL